MALMILGLVLFLGLHSSRVFAEDFRSRIIAERGANAWKGIYSLVSLVGFVLIVYGYSEARLTPTVLWTPPVWTKHVAALLTLPAFILLAAAQLPNWIKRKVGHPMVLGTKLWAASHLLANGNLVDVVLFGAFLLWSIVLFGASRRRDRRNGVTYPPGTAATLTVVIVAGIGIWALFALYLHALLIGVRPFG